MFNDFDFIFIFGFTEGLAFSVWYEHLHVTRLHSLLPEFRIWVPVSVLLSVRS